MAKNLPPHVLTALKRKYRRLIDECADMGDPEAAHGDADALLCDLLRELGFDYVAETFESMHKWYA